MLAALMPLMETGVYFGGSLIGLLLVIILVLIILRILRII